MRVSVEERERLLRRYFFSTVSTAQPTCSGHTCRQLTKAPAVAAVAVFARLDLLVEILSFIDDSCSLAKLAIVGRVWWQAARRMPGYRLSGLDYTIWGTTGGEFGEPLVDCKIGVDCMAAASDRKLAYGCNSSMHLLDLSTGRHHLTMDPETGFAIPKYLGGAANGFAAVSVPNNSGPPPSLPQGHEQELLLSWTQGGTVKIWDAKTGSCLNTIVHGDQERSGPVFAAVALPGGLVAYGGGESGKHSRIFICSILTESPDPVRTLSGHEKYVTALVALPRDMLASGGSDCLVRIWNARTGNCLHTLAGHSGSIKAMVCLPANRLASGSSDKTVRIWSMATGQHIRTLTYDSVTDCTALISLPGTSLLAWASSSKLPHEDTDEDEQEDEDERPLCLYDEELRKNGSSRVVLVDTETGRFVKTLLRGGYSAANSLAILPGVGGGVLVAGTYAVRGSDPSFTVWRC